MTRHDFLVAVIAYTAGVTIGWMVFSDHSAPPAVSQRLAKTDGVVCWADNADTGPHWFVRSDGICYAEDSPALHVDEKALQHVLETTGRPSKQ